MTPSPRPESIQAEISELAHARDADKRDFFERQQRKLDGGDASVTSQSVLTRYLAARAARELAISRLSPPQSAGSSPERPDRSVTPDSHQARAPLARHSSTPIPIPSPKAQSPIASSYGSAFTAGTSHRRRQ